ncbi:glyoxalase [Flavobacterium sp. F-380]|uniref:Glyoxalase n=1 Tax=Flavobacterium kayseriense TaxID=2764714 RepID=A0ABR7J9L6_9FLAO|nr:glyoxalase [Flavobacterium kayseriense]MBC5841897.1 glyoxalase [Flavobacterium kayseriense]MBC5848426.1 glyoxalase [Flavobacterium kayseriense]
MIERDTFIKDLRGQTIGSISTDSSAEEIFQNRVLRPILKLQNDLFIASFKNYITKYKGDFYNLTIDKRLGVIENALQKDVKYRNTLKGMVIGLFTMEEYLLYSNNSSNLSKRMMTMLLERLKSQVQLFDQPRDIEKK